MPLLLLFSFVSFSLTSRGVSHRQNEIEIRMDSLPKTLEKEKLELQADANASRARAEAVEESLSAARVRG